MKGIITDIHRTSTVDGPGIRTTVFTKGCPLSCIWCHNPETQNREIEGSFGREITAEEVVSECLKDAIYYETSGGGVTVSGGEPFQQFDFVLEILKRLKKQGVHTALDMTGVASRQMIEQSLAVTDLYLFDYKATDPDVHKQLTGMAREPLLTTLDFLVRQGANITLRCPLIPGVNDQLEHLLGICRMENKYPAIQAIEILPWHTMGLSKYKILGRKMDDRLPEFNTSAEKIFFYREFFATIGNGKIKVLGLDS